LRLAICQSLDQYANVRPTRILNGIKSPLRGVRAQDLDWVIIRENSEGEYSGHGGRSHRGSSMEAATEVSVFTRAGVERIMRFAFEVARSRPRKELTVVTKSNAQLFGMVLWRSQRRFRQARGGRLDANYAGPIHARCVRLCM
jgi:tartrate dehydrogenase/decarboxylase/D-malate dehydrogenase